ncbi:hypothetical protein Scep_028069 [Stephania cephalantha]|uniref:Uncharacterized protein n=1 Tax=Stephania cephalantha TaxID=152367 RepID=A0AAP0ECF6_9MAGN
MELGGLEAKAPESRGSEQAMDREGWTAVGPEISRRWFNSGRGRERPLVRTRTGAEGGGAKKREAYYIKLATDHQRNNAISNSLLFMLPSVYPFPKLIRRYPLLME